MVLRISDTGGGIPPDALTRIFEPYFSTKAKVHDHSGHSGLGLAITRKIVLDAGGFIMVESRLGEGTTFEVYLPEARTVVPREDPALIERILATPLLVVDDEPMLASALSKNLGLEGFRQVHVATTATDALRLLREHPEIGGMIFDKQLPDMSGLKLLREARNFRPNLPALLFTGEDAEVMRPYLGDHTDALGKPSQLPQIRTSLFNLLGNYFKSRNL
jgi:CheY-like chemotaxis protein